MAAMSSAQIISATAFHSKMALARGPGCPAVSGVSGAAWSQRPHQPAPSHPSPSCRAGSTGQTTFLSLSPLRPGEPGGRRDQGPRGHAGSRLSWYWNHLPGGLGRDTADLSQGTKPPPVADYPRSSTQLAQFTDGKAEVPGPGAEARALVQHHACP